MTVARDDPTRWYRRKGYAVRAYDATRPTQAGIIVHYYDAHGVYGPRWEVYDASEVVEVLQLRLWKVDA